MKILKYILLAVVSLIISVFIIALFVKKDFAVEQSVVIAKPKNQVFEYVKHLKNQNDYGSWYQIDPDMKKTFKGEDGKVGFVSAWESDNDKVGAGEQEITYLVEGERMETLLKFKKPFESQSKAYLTTESIDELHTKVCWGFNGSMPYPFNIIRLFVDMEQQVGKDFKQGLINMKKILEK